jgi:DNA polymerase-3 subunit gamma/tau
MQILVETKSRMQRVTYGRALLELALVRICLLENLDEISGLILSMREALTDSGVAPNRPVARPANVSRPGTSPPPAGARKKNELSDSSLSRSEAAPAAPAVGCIVDPAGSAAAKSVDLVAPLTDQTLQEIWDKVVASQNDVTANHLRNALRVAISGPNGLEIVFPARYSFGRTFCQRPETLARLRACLREVLGQEISVTISSEGGLEVPVNTGAAPAINRRASLDAMEKNEFVQQVTSIFGGTLLDVRPVAATNQHEA